MTNGDIYGVVIAGLGAAIIGLVTAVLNHRARVRDRENDHDEKVNTQLLQRIAALEQANEDCMRETAMLTKRIGFLEGKLGMDIKEQ